MLSRLFSLFIVAFWVWMTALLVRLEVQPERSRLLDVPAAHVWKLMFAHEQISNLNIVGNGSAIGHLMLHPKRDDASGERLFEFNGALWLRTTSAPSQRVLWSGSVRLDEGFRLGRTEIDISPRGSGFTTNIRIEPHEKRASYEMKSGDRMLRGSSFTLDEAGLRKVLREADIDESILTAVNPSQIGAVTMVAKQSTLKIRNETIEAYMLTLRLGETALAELWVSELGQVLLVKTPFGYSLNAEDISL